MSAILVGVLSYVVVAGALPSTGHDRVVAVVVAHDEELTVLGDGPVASDLREVAERPDATLTTTVEGMSYYLLDGPHDFDSDDVAALGRVYGVSSTSPASRSTSRSV